jgi:hypothetical protein
MPIIRLIKVVVLSGIMSLMGCSSTLQPSGQGGSGGTPATGGTGGTLATGGTRATGGAPATGGTPATGGASGAGGGAGPVPCGATVCTSSEFCCDPLCSVCSPIGSLCSTGCVINPDGGTATGVCASLAAQYERAVVAAQACTVGGGGCAAMVHSSLATSACGCDFIYVNDATEANSIYQTWMSFGCQPKSLCGGTVCSLPAQSGVCVATDGGASGVCQFGTPTSSGPDAGSCESLVAAYQTALAAALSCNENASGQCAVAAWAALPVMGCPSSCVWVNDDTALNAIHLQWQGARCQGFGACKTPTCPTLAGGQCVSVDAGQARCYTPAAP